MSLPPDLFTTDLAWAAAIVFFGAAIKGFAGFGGAIFAIPLMIVVFGPAVAVPLVVLLEIPTTIQLWPRAVRSANWRLIAPIGIAHIVTIPLGTFVLVAMDPDLLRRGTGLLVLGLVAAMWLGWHYRGEVRVSASVIAGALAGLLAGIAAMGGTVIALYLLSFPDRVERIRGTILTLAGMVITYLVVMHLYHGLTSSLTVWRTIVLTPAVLIGAWIGTRLFISSSEILFRRVGLICIATAGFIAIIK